LSFFFPFNRCRWYDEEYHHSKNLKKKIEVGRITLSASRKSCGLAFKARRRI
jgi:hypothetical protein